MAYFILKIGFLTIVLDVLLWRGYSERRSFGPVRVVRSANLSVFLIGVLALISYIDLCVLVPGLADRLRLFSAGAFDVNGLSEDMLPRTRFLFPLK